MKPDRTHNLLSLSDLHLGCDLKPASPFGDASRAGLDRLLSQFIDHHNARREENKPWRLLLAGDIFDFVAVTAVPGALLTSPFAINAEERALGLNSEEAKSVWKLRRIAARHEEVFHALARFLVAGNEVHFVRGNHDAELQFPLVQRELIRLLARRAGVQESDGDALNAFESRIQFHAWFYLEPGLIYLEHGNAHDRYCLQSGFFDEPPAAQTELELPMSSKVLRYFAARWAREQDDFDDADKMNAAQYIAWIFRMGRPLQIALDFFVLIVRVLRPVAQQALQLWRNRRSADNSVQRDLESVRLRRVQQWLSRFSCEDNLKQARQLLAVASRPAEQSLFAAAQLFYVDRMLLLLATAIASAAAISMGHGWEKLLGCTLALAIFIFANRSLARRRRCDAHLLLREAAGLVANIFDVRLVVMGHSHHQVDELVAARTRYLNLGSWTPDGNGLPHLKLIGDRAEVKSFAPRPRELPDRPPVLPEAEGGSLSFAQ